ncbi:hypothetical protein [uncultured Allofournierella sp.]|uniref:hypothetical protein n=1 Tax=uncultured Allofournierella sp. TaxID=1940258 RepID=UPI0025E0BF17|nr:hypothetical protein [uncultured Fournierella sp.]
MKRTTAFVLAVLLSILLTGCIRTKHITLPFTASDVERVEMFHYVVPADAEKKTVTQPEDIAGLVDTFDGLSVTNKETAPVAGGSVTSFRFRLFDGTIYEIVYSSIAVKSGRISTTSSGQDFFTSADIEASWSNCDYEAVPAAENELPFVF